MLPDERFALQQRSDPSEKIVYSTYARSAREYNLEGTPIARYGEFREVIHCLLQPVSDVLCPGLRLAHSTGGSPHGRTPARKNFGSLLVPEGVFKRQRHYSYRSSRVDQVTDARAKPHGTIPNVSKLAFGSDPQNAAGVRQYRLTDPEESGRARPAIRFYPVEAKPLEQAILRQRLRIDGSIVSAPAEDRVRECKRNQRIPP
jgi:hypothetical protein